MSRLKKSPGWKKSQTTPTNKVVKSDASIDHIGDRFKHLLDQSKARAVHDRRVLEKVGIGAPAWDAGLDEALAAVGLSPGPGFPSGVQAKLEKSIGAALANRGVLLTVGNVPRDGDRLNGREWRVMPGEEWSPQMKQERKWRSKYRDDNYNASSRLDLAMEAQYCRLPPWLAMVVKSAMAHDPEQVAEMMVKLGKLFAERYGVDVIGLGLHSENGHDWHIHILYSRSLERINETGAGRKGRTETTRLNGIMREELKAAGEPATPKAVAAALRKAIAFKRFSDPRSVTRKIEYVRRQEKISAAEVRAWGPAYRNKFWIYRAASGLDRERVAESNDRPVGDPGGFRWWLGDLEAAGNSPEEHFSDVWTENQWQKICQRTLAPRELKTVDDLREKCVKNYLELRTSMPTPIEAVAAHLQRERKRVLQLEKENADRERLEGQLAAGEAGESLVHAARRFVEERVEIGNALEGVSDSGSRGIVSAVEHLVDRVSVAESDEKNLREILQPKDSETLVDTATYWKRRIDGLVDKLENQTKEAALLRTERDSLSNLTEKIVATIGPEPDESILATFQRLKQQAAITGSALALAEKRKREIENLKSDLDHSRRKKTELEAEITPLRNLRKIVETFLKLFLELPIAQKLGTKLPAILRDMGSLVGYDFGPRKDSEKISPQ